MVAMCDRVAWNTRVGSSEISTTNTRTGFLKELSEGQMLLPSSSLVLFCLGYF